MTPYSSGSNECQKFHPYEIAIRSATAHLNPFLVEVTALLHGPDGESTAIPGYYDGDGEWKIRFSPNAEGVWRFATQSVDPVLDGHHGEVRCVANGNPHVHGALGIDRSHPYHFTHEDGTRPFVLGYEANWLWALGFTERGAERLRRFIDLIASQGFNHVFVNAYAHDVKWRLGNTSADDFGPPPAYAWAGSNVAPDHLHLNPDYWRVFDAMVRALFERGLTAHIFLKVYNKLVNWPAPRSLADELFFKYVVARYQGFSNVVWDFSKESYNEPDKVYLENRLRLIKSHDGHRRLVTTHDDKPFCYDPRFATATDFLTDQNHYDLAATVMEQRRRRQCPVINAEFAYECGPGGRHDTAGHSHAHSAEEHVLRSWEVVTGGGYPGYYFTHMAWDFMQPEVVPRGYLYHLWLVDFMRESRWWELEPHREFARIRCWCLANPDQEYVIYRPPEERRTVQVNVPANLGQLDCEWLHPLTGARAQSVIGSGYRIPLESPFGDAPFVVRIRPQSPKSR